MRRLPQDQLFIYAERLRCDTMTASELLELALNAKNMFRLPPTSGVDCPRPAHKNITFTLDNDGRRRRAKLRVGHARRPANVGEVDR